MTRAVVLSAVSFETPAPQAPQDEGRLEARMVLQITPHAEEARQRRLEAYGGKSA